MSSKRIETVRRGADTALITLFVAALGWVLAATVLVPRADLDDDEKRALAPLPGLTPLSKFPTRFDRFFNDHFGGREALIRGHHLAMVRGLGISPSARVVLGEDSWLFYGTAQAIDSYRRTRPMDTSERTAWKRTLRRKGDWLAARGIDYLFVVAPNKSTIYPERMPTSIRRSSGPSRLDQLMETVGSDGQPAVLDLRGALLRAKRDDPVYFRTDTHWNGFGAAIAADEIRRAVAERQRSTGADPFRLAKREVTRQGGDLARMLRLRDWYAEASQEVTLASTSQVRLVRSVLQVSREYVSDGETGRPSALVFHDSFGDALMPFLVEPFSRVRFVRGRFDPDLVGEYRPDVVIEEIGERFLMDDPPALPRALP